MSQYKISTKRITPKSDATDFAVRRIATAKVTRQDAPEGDWIDVGRTSARGFTPRAAEQRVTAKAHKIVADDKAKRAAAIRQALDKHSTT